MKCDRTMDLIYHYSGDSMPLHVQLQIAVHLFFCDTCARKNAILETSREIMINDLFPQSPDFEESVMRIIASEKSAETQSNESQVIPGVLSVRGWIIAGIIILVSLTSAFFGLEFTRLAHIAGMSFLLPLGITVGIVLTSYGALFIGSHLNELSRRLGL